MKCFLRRFILALALLLGIATMADAQFIDRDYSGFVCTWTSEGGFPLNGHKKLRMASSAIELGYSFNKRWSLFVPVTGTIAMFKKENGIRRYEPAWTLGLGAGFNLLYTDDDRLELVARCSNTLIDPSDWDYTSYDLGVRYNCDDKNHKIKMFMGLGVCYYDRVKGPMNNYCNLYAVLGFRFGK